MHPDLLKPLVSVPVFDGEVDKEAVRPSLRPKSKKDRRRELKRQKKARQVLYGNVLGGVGGTFATGAGGASVKPCLIKLKTAMSVTEGLNVKCQVLALWLALGISEVTITLTVQERTELDRDLAEAKAVVSREQRREQSTAVITTVFVIYLRVLKQARNHALLPPVLQGLAKYAKPFPSRPCMG
jgi:hypothetical protein